MKEKRYTSIGIQIIDLYNSPYFPFCILKKYQDSTYNIVWCFKTFQYSLNYFPQWPQRYEFPLTMCKGSSLFMFIPSELSMCGQDYNFSIAFDFLVFFCTIFWKDYSPDIFSISSLVNQLKVCMHIFINGNTIWINYI